MPQMIEVPGMGVVEFPDDMNDDQIVAAIRANMPEQEQAQEEKSFLQKAADYKIPGGDVLGMYVPGTPQFMDTVLGAGDAVANQMRNVANLAPWTDLPEIQPKSEGMQYDVGGLLGETAGFMGGGAGLNAARKSAEVLPAIGKGAEWLGKSGVIPSMARYGSGGAAYGGIMNPEDRLTGAAIGGSVGAASPAISKGIGKLMPSNWTSLAPEQLKRNLDVAKGTETNLGAITGSPQLKGQYENILPKIPLSGANAQMVRVGDEIGKRSDKILSKYLGDTAPSEVENKLKLSLMNAFENQKSYKNSLYTAAQETAPKVGFSLKPDKLRDALFEHKDALSSMKGLDQQAKEMLHKAMNPIKNPSGGPSQSQVSLKDSNLLASKLNTAAKTYRVSPTVEDATNARVLGSVGSALKGDIRQSIKDTGSSKLTEQFAAAEKNYKDNYSKFLDKDIYKFTDKDAKAEDILSTFIKTGKNTDKGEQLNKLMSKLDPEAKDLAKYSYLSRAMKGAEDTRKTDASQLKNLWKDSNLGQNQKRALMPEKAERQEMDKLGELIDLNPKAVNYMFNPPTGQMNLSAIPLIAGGGIVGGATGALHSDNTLEGTLRGALMGAGLMGGARGASKLLSSESLRNALVAQMMKPKNAELGMKSLGGTGLAQSLASALGN